MNNSNLKNLKTRTKQERQLIAKKGNLASLQVRQEKKKIRELANEVIFNNNLTQEEVKELKECGLKDKDNYTTATYLIYSLIKKAKKGDVRAFEKLMELTGEGEFNKTLELKRREVELREREFKLKEKTFNLNNGDENTTVIIKISDEGTTTQEIKNNVLENAKTVIVNDLPNCD